MLVPGTTAVLDQLLRRFETLERQAQVLERAPDGALVIVRADGIKASRRFLSRTLEQPDYHNALHNAVTQVYYIWRNWAPKADSPYLLGVLRLSDEVSFILNRGANYYERRLLKMTSTLASTLSGAMSLAYAGTGAASQGRPPVMAFDGRPLLVREADELTSYVRCRRLLHARNAMTKVLRLCSDMSEDDLYGGQAKLASDIDRLSQVVEAHGLWRQFERAAGGSQLYVAKADGRLASYTLPADPNNDSDLRAALGTFGLA